MVSHGITGDSHDLSFSPFKATNVIPIACVTVIREQVCTACLHTGEYAGIYYWYTLSPALRYWK